MTYRERERGREREGESETERERERERKRDRKRQWTLSLQSSGEPGRPSSSQACVKRGSLIKTK